MTKPKFDELPPRYTFTLNSSRTIASRAVRVARSPHGCASLRCSSTSIRSISLRWARPNATVRRASAASGSSRIRTNWKMNRFARLRNSIRPRLAMTTRSGHCHGRSQDVAGRIDSADGHRRDVALRGGLQTGDESGCLARWVVSGG